MLMMINAIPTGKKNISLTPLNIKKITPLTVKSIAAVLYDFTLSDDLLFIVKKYLYNNRGWNKCNPQIIHCQYLYKK
jgi:hypothetical protein